MPAGTSGSRSPPRSDDGPLGLGFAYGFYTLAAGLSFFFVLKFVPETRSKELEEM